MIKATRVAVLLLKSGVVPSDTNSAICCVAERRSIATVRAWFGSLINAKVPWFVSVREM